MSFREVIFRFHYYFVTMEPYPLLLRIYRMVLEPPKQDPMHPDDEEATVRPRDLAPQFKERTRPVLSEHLPEEMRQLITKLNSAS